MELRRLRENPYIRLTGSVDDQMLNSFLGQLDGLLKGAQGPPESLVVEVTTQGGNADDGERLAEEIRLVRKAYGVDCMFLGNTYIYSAGVTFLSAFPVANRYLTRNTLLLIHERQANLQVNISGPLSSGVPELQALLAQLESGQMLQNRGFARLVEGTDIRMEEILARAARNWYLSAEEALARRLVAALV